MISRSVRPILSLIRRPFCQKKPIQITEEDWKKVKLFAVTGDYPTTNNEDLFFKTLEQQLSLKLLQTKTHNEVMELLNKQKPQDLTPDILFLFLYCYAKFSSPLTGQMRTHLDKVILQQDSLDNMSLLKLYEMLLKIKDKVKVSVPKVRKMDIEIMVEFVFLLSQIFSEHEVEPWLEAIDKQSADQNQSTLLELVRRYPRNKKLTQLAEESFSDCDDSMQLAKIAIIYLEGGQKTKARSAINKLKAMELDANTFVNLLLRLLDQKQFESQWQKLLPELKNTDLKEINHQTYLNLWAMVAKIKSSDVRQDLVNRLTNVNDIDQVNIEDISNPDRFSIVISAAFLNIPHRQFVRQVLEGIKIEQLTADNAFFLMMACRKMGLKDYEQAYKMDVMRRQDEVQPRLMALLKKQPK